MRLFYFLKEAVRGFYQAKLMTFVSVITIGLTLFFLGCMAVGYVNVRQALRTAAGRVAAIAYVDDNAAADAARLTSLVARVKALPQVASARVVDKEEAWRRFKAENDSAMLQAVDENPFPVSVEITVGPAFQSAASLDTLSRELAATDGIEDVRMSRSEMRRIERYRWLFLMGTVVFCVILVIAPNVMISNTIKLTIYARREIIRNMQFVGATPAYIKAPFIIEGMLQGVFGGCFGAAALLAVKAALSHFVLVWGPWYLVVLLFVATGALFGCIGSMSAVRRFLAS
jgi:cell division transport system permease protein